MRTSTVEIREALTNYRDAVDIACQMEQELFIAERQYEAAIEEVNRGSQDDIQRIDNASQHMISITAKHIHHQFELAKMTKTLDILIELAKLEVASDRLRQPKR